MNKKWFKIFSLTIVALLIPLTVFTVQKQQTLRQQAHEDGRRSSIADKNPTDTPAPTDTPEPCPRQSSGKQDNGGNSSPTPEASPTPCPTQTQQPCPTPTLEPSPTPTSAKKKGKKASIQDVESDSDDGRSSISDNNNTKNKKSDKPTPTPCAPLRSGALIPIDLLLTLFPTQPATQAAVPTQTPFPTPTINPIHTKFAVDLSLSGIGSPSGNPLPVASQRSVKIEVFDKKNKKILEQSGVITFNASSETFIGIIDMGNALKDGFYTVKVTTSRYLRKLIPGILKIAAGELNKIPQTFAIAGDINSDNVIDVKDYNIYVACFGAKADSARCGKNRIFADLNDDGVNDGPGNLTDYKLLFSAFANQSGD